MEARIAKLEEFATDAKERLVKLESRLEQTATKADLNEKVGALQVEMHKGFSDMVKWVVGTAIVLGGTAITVMTFVLNNASPKTPPPLPPIYYIQPQPPPAPAVQPAAANATTQPAPK